MSQTSQPHSKYTHKKYRPQSSVSLPDRTWPDQSIETAPRWCAVDLRDGNQALIEPMTVEQKLQMWDLLVKTGFKEIEIGFPSSSQPDFDFARRLIEEGRIPEDVTIQVLVQARKELIDRTFEALKGAKRAIIHLYNSTSPVQRDRVFQTDKAGVIEIAVQGARWVLEGAERHPETLWQFQYSPESFSQTEVDFAAEVCDAVVSEWVPHTDRMIVNLPATVEVSSPNVFADQVELFCRLSKFRQEYELSLHTHNDRGCAVAAAELGVMAGADRIEGTLLGNGERTGNMDIVTMALNLYSQGIDPRLDFSRMDEIISTVTRCTDIPVHPRQPYAGDLVFTAFSGSHQDAIRKCLATQKNEDIWQVAYLPINPADLGRSYQDVIRVNSQSGKGGVAYLLERDHHLHLPRWLQVEASRVVQSVAEEQSRELSSDEIYSLFIERFVTSSCTLSSYRLNRTSAGNSLRDTIEATISGCTFPVTGEGGGALAAMTDALGKAFGLQASILDFAEHAIDRGTDSKAIAYVLMSAGNQRRIGVAIDTDATQASLQAVINCFQLPYGVQLSA